MLSTDPRRRSQGGLPEGGGPEFWGGVWVCTGSGVGEIQWMEEAGHASLADLADIGIRSRFWIQTILY